MVNQELTLKKPVLLRFFLVCFIVVEFNILQHVPIPGLLVLSDSLMLLILLSFYAYYFLMSIRYRQISKFLLILTLTLLVPLLSGIQAQRVFGQPFIYGFLAERTKFFILSPLLLVYLIDAGYLDLQSIEKILVRISIVYFLAALILYVFIDPRLFEGTSFVIFSSTRGTRYNMNQALVIILLFYSVYRALEGWKLNYLAMALSILIYLIVFVKGRSLLFAIFLTLVYLVLVRLTWKQRIAFISFSIVVLFLSGVIGGFLFRDNLSNVFSLFVSAFNALTGGEAQDGSSASRVLQVDIALEGIKENPVLGNGFLSAQWNKGFQGRFRYFYPSDIGWLGLLYVNGIIGFILMNAPFFLSWLYSRKMKNIEKDLFLKVMESFMLYLFIHSAFAAFAIKKVGMIAFPFAIIYFYYFWHATRSKEAEVQSI